MPLLPLSVAVSQWKAACENTWWPPNFAQAHCPSAFPPARAIVSIAALVHYCLIAFHHVHRNLLRVTTAQANLAKYLKRNRHGAHFVSTEQGAREVASALCKDLCGMMINVFCLSARFSEGRPNSSWGRLCCLMPRRWPARLDHPSHGADGLASPLLHYS